MKNVPLIVSVAALIVAVIALVGKPGSTKTKASSENMIAGANKIAYVNLDTLVDAYDYYNEEKTALLTWQNEKEVSLDSRYKALQRKAMEIQQQVQNRMMTPTTAQKKGEQLQYQEQEILQDKQTYEYQIMERNQKLTLSVFDSVKNYLEIYNEDKGYNLVLANDTLGTSILLAGSEMDITNDIVTGLNLRFRSAKPDSTKVK